MKYVVTVREPVVAISLPYLPITAANALDIDVCDQVPHRLPKMQDQNWLTGHWRMFQDGAGTVLHLSVRIKMTDTITINKQYQITAEFPNLDDQQSLTLCWPSCSVWGREGVAFSFACKGGQNSHYVPPLPNHVLNTLHIRPEIVDAALTLIFTR